MVWKINKYSVTMSIKVVNADKNNLCFFFGLVKKGSWDGSTVSCFQALCVFSLSIITCVSSMKTINNNHRLCGKLFDKRSQILMSLVPSHFNNNI